MREAILRRVAVLPAGRTICPGQVARELGSDARTLRPVYAAMAAAGELQVTQGGVAADLATLRGPYRLGPRQLAGVPVTADCRSG